MLPRTDRQVAAVVGLDAVQQQQQHRTRVDQRAGQRLGHCALDLTRERCDRGEYGTSGGCTEAGRTGVVVLVVVRIGVTRRIRLRVRVGVRVRV
jgi:hypothetical protein